MYPYIRRNLLWFKDQWMYLILSINVSISISMSYLQREHVLYTWDLCEKWLYHETEGVRTKEEACRCRYSSGVAYIVHVFTYVNILRCTFTRKKTIKEMYGTCVIMGQSNDYKLYVVTWSLIMHVCKASSNNFKGRQAGTHALFLAAVLVLLSVQLCCVMEQSIIYLFHFSWGSHVS